MISPEAWILVNQSSHFVYLHQFVMLWTDIVKLKSDLQCCAHSSAATKAELHRSYSPLAATVQEYSYFWVAQISLFYNISFMPMMFILVFAIDNHVTDEIC